MESKIRMELREWACVEGHVFWRNAAMSRVRGDARAAVEALVENGRILCACGGRALDHFPVGAITGPESCYPEIGTAMVEIPADDIFFDATGKPLRAGERVSLGMRDFSSLFGTEDGK